MPHYLLPRPGPDQKIVNFKALAPNWLDYILPGSDRTETIYRQPKINKFQTNKHGNAPCMMK